ncbi:MAG: helix-turn-helix domain-containing protein [Actinomycetota bacterium]
MTVGEVAKYLRMHQMTIYRMANEGRLPGYRVGSRWRFLREEIDAWLRQQGNTQSQKL